MSLEILSRVPDSTGGRPPVLFVHGAFCGAWVWEEHFLPYFAARGYPAHALSLRGHGASPGRGGLATASLADYVEDLASAVARIGGEPVLVGHSMGGMVVQRFLRERGARGAVLMASVPPHGLWAAATGMWLRHPLLAHQVALFQAFGPRAVDPDVVGDLLFSERLPRRRLMHYVTRVQGESGRVVWDMLGGDLAPLDGHGATPVLVLGAAADVFVSPHLVRGTAEAFGTRAEIFPGMAHAMMLDRGWERVAGRVAGWLDGITATARNR